MNIKVERAVCKDCRHEINDFEIAIERDGEILCRTCLKKFSDDGFESFMEWLLGDDLTYGHNFRKKWMEEERVIAPRGRD